MKTLPEQRGKLRELDAKATPGPWVSNQPGTIGWVETAVEVDGGLPVAKCATRGDFEQAVFVLNASFIATTRTFAPDAADDIEELLRALEQVRAAFPLHNLRGLGVKIDAILASQGLSDGLCERCDRPVDKPGDNVCGDCLLSDELDSEASWGD